MTFLLHLDLTASVSTDNTLFPLALSSQISEDLPSDAILGIGHWAVYSLVFLTFGPVSPGPKKTEHSNNTS